MAEIKIGSLFDGIGAFPYAASMFGIKTVWASEILPAAISVTRRYFPDMVHVGDITKLSGELLPPVDVIVFGSPCQDLSQAAGGNRKGLDGERSGLFAEAIRIINEMRESTNGKYPRYACWENVPGCFSSNGRRDYKAVLEAFTECEIPMPKSGKWATAGMVRSDRANIAWCVYNAANFGLAQRRKRVFLIADFGAGCPEKILFVPKSLRWYPPQSFCEGQGVTAATPNCSDVASGFDGYNGQLTGKVSSTLGVNCGMSTGRNGVVYGICSANSNSMKSSNPHSGIYEANTARTLDLNCGNPSCNQGGMAVVGINGNIAGTLDANYHKGTGMRCGVERDVVLCAATGQSNTEILKERSPTLNCNCEQPYICKENKVFGFNGGASPASGIAVSEKVSPTLRAGPGSTMTPHICEILNDQGGDSINVEKGGHSPTLRHATHGNLPIVCTADGESKNPHVVHPEIAGTLCASAAGLSRPGGMGSETDLTVAYCLQGNMIGRENKNGPAGSGVNENVSFSLTGADRHVVAHTFGNNSIGGWNEKPATIKASSGSNGGGSENIVLQLPPPYVVRRLTPTECERLMGFPDGYTGFGQDESGKVTEISDSKRYSMLGNSIATPCAAYIIQGILEQYEKEEQNWRSK